MSMIYKKTTGAKQKQPIHECLAPPHQEDPHHADIERRRRTPLLNIERPVGDVRRRVGDDAVLFNLTENWSSSSLLSEAAARTTTTFTTPGELNYFTTRKRNLITLENSCNNNKYANLGSGFSGGTLFREPSVPTLFNNNLNFENRNMLRIEFQQPPTKSGPYHHVNDNNDESNFVFSGIVSSPSSTTAQPEQIISDTTADQFKLNTTTQSSRQIFNNYPGTTEDYCLTTHNNNNNDVTIQKMTKNKSPRSNVSHFPDSFHQSIISDQRTLTRPSIKGNSPKVDVVKKDRRLEITPILIPDDGNLHTRPIIRGYSPRVDVIKKDRQLEMTATPIPIPGERNRHTRPVNRGNASRVDVVERDRQLVITPIVIADDTPNINNNNNTTEQPNTTPRTPSFFKSKKKETNVPKTVAFSLKGKSCFNFFNDADLKRMVGDLRAQMSAKGVCVFDHFLGVEKSKKVLNDVLNLYKNDCFVNGQLESSYSSSSPSSSLNNMRVIRGDVIKWLTGNEKDCGNIKYLMERIDAAVMLCGEQMFGGYTIKQRTRAMVACYPGNGTHYLRHIDNPCRNGRVLTCIYYLNLNWDVRTDGGLLRIYPNGIDEVANVEPIFDRVLFFWSDARNPHEVKPAYRQRFAITLWYYDEIEHLDWQRRRNAEIQST